MCMEWNEGDVVAHRTEVLNNQHSITIGVADDLDPLVGGEERTFPVVAGISYDQPIDDPDRAPDDVRMSVGDRVEGARIDPDPRLGHLSPSLICWLCAESS